MAYQWPCKTCGYIVSAEARACPSCGQPEPVLPFLAGLTIGNVYPGRVTALATSFALVELAPGVEGVLHASEIRHEAVKRIEDVLSKNDTFDVRLLDIDNNGRLKLSSKAVQLGNANGQYQTLPYPEPFAPQFALA